MPNHPKIDLTQIEIVRSLASQGLSDPEIGNRLTPPTASHNVYQFRLRNKIPGGRTAGGQPGAANAAWKGGRNVDKDGYILVWKPEHPSARGSGYVLEHRLVMEEKLGRYLTPEEVVHHKDDDHANNDPSNLYLYSENREHLKDTLTGRCPQWTADGKQRIQAGIEKARQRNLGRHLSDAHRAAIGAAQRPNKSPETRARMSEAARQRWQRRRDARFQAAQAEPTHQ